MKENVRNNYIFINTAFTLLVEEDEQQKIDPIFKPRLSLF